MKKDTTIIGVISPEIDRKLLAILTPIREQATRDAIIHAKKYRPTPGERVFSHASLIKSSYEGGHAQMMSDMKPEVHAAKYARDKAEMTKRKKEIDAESIELEHCNLLDERNLKTTNATVPFKRNPWIVALFLFMYAAEAYFNSLAFEFFGGIPIATFALGIAIAVVEAYLSSKIAELLGRVAEEGKKAYVKAGAFALLNAAIIIAMSVMRSQVIDDAHGGMPMWIFFVLTVGMIITSIPLSKKVFPTQKENEEQRKEREQQDAINERKDKIKKLSEERTALNAAEEALEDNFQFIKSQVVHIGRRAETHYRETIEIFKSENLITRNDGRTPACFTAPAPALSFLIPNLDANEITKH